MPGPRSGSIGGKWSGRRRGHEQEQAEYDVVRSRRADSSLEQRHLSRCENKNVTSEANSVSDALKVEGIQGVLVTGKAFKIAADAGVNPGGLMGEIGAGLRRSRCRLWASEGFWRWSRVKFSRVSRRCDGIADEFGAIWWGSMGSGTGAVIGVRGGTVQGGGRITKGTKVREHDRGGHLRGGDLRLVGGGGSGRG